MKLDAGTEPGQLEALLADVPPIGNLLPAVVVSVAPAAARVYLRGGGFAQIGWDGMAWTHGDAANGRADSLLHRGDLVYVISDGRGGAQRGQGPEGQGALGALDPPDGARGGLVGGLDYFSNAS